MIVLSTKEKAVGISALDADGRISYPETIPVPGDPTAMAAGDVDGDGLPELFVVSKHEDKWHAFLLDRSKAGAMEVSRSFEMSKLSVKKDEPNGLLVLDIDQDGRDDLLVFDRYKTMRTYHQEANGTFTDLSDKPDYGGGLVEKKRLKDLARIDLNDDGKEELVVASKNFARALVLAKGHLTVKDQVNARSSSSQIKSLTGVDLTGDGVPEVALLDSDGDQCTNGFELGDPSGNWNPEEAYIQGDQSGNPGIPDCAPSSAPEASWGILKAIFSDAASRSRTN